jgi:hypothetical protein
VAKKERIKAAEAHTTANHLKKFHYELPQRVGQNVKNTPSRIEDMGKTKITICLCEDMGTIILKTIDIY